ncbi:MAG: GDP-mannose 4,6-dehydratase [Gemmatimonadota bacterium]
MTTLVTGGAGFIGSHLTERLLVRDEEVVVLDNFDSFYDPAIKDRNLERARDFETLTEVRGDIRDEDGLRGLPDGIDTVIHIAALAGVRPSIADPVRYYDVNEVGTATLLKWAAEREIDRFLFASSSSVYGNNEKVPFSEDDPVDHPISPYAATKKAGELLCHTYHHLYGMTVACLRLFTVYGPRQRPDLAIHKFARLLAKGEPIPMYGDGTTRRDYTYIEDLLQGLRGAMMWADERVDSGEPGYTVVNLGESRTIELKEMIAVVADEMGVEAEIERLPMQPGDVDRTWADISKARELFGYDPEWDFREGVREFVRWFREVEEDRG